MTSPSHAPTEDALKRSLSGPMLLLLVVGDILGAGIYILVGDVAGELGGMAWLAFLLAFSIAALSAASYSALVTRFPGPSGSALYAERAFERRHLTFAVGMAVMLSSLSTAATTARAFAGDYLGEFVELPVPLITLCLILGLTLLNLRGIEASARANVAMTVTEIGGLVLVIAIGAMALADGGGDPGRIVDTGDLALSGLLTATSLAFFAFLGFEDAVHLSAEVRDGRRVFPPVLFGAVAIASVLYLAVVLIATSLVPTDTLAASDGPLLEVVQQGPWAVSPRWFSLIALVAVSNTSLFALVASSRLLFGMAREGSLPSELGRVHRRRQTPLVASVLVAFGAAGLAMTGAVEELAGAAVTLLLGVLVLVNWAAWSTRRHPSAAAAFAPAPWIPLTGAALSGTLLTHQIATFSTADALRLGGLAGVVVLLWGINEQRRSRRQRRAPDDSGASSPVVGDH